MLAAALHAAGRDPVHNRAGSNMAWGVATALLEGGGDEGLFEVDEAWLPRVADELAPTLLVLGNLFRDQLDRYGELERLADEWAAVVAGREGRTSLVLNADDPLIADLGRDRELRRRAGVTFFGIEDPPRPARSSSTRSTPSIAAAAGPRTATSAPSSATSVTTAARTAAPTAPPLTSTRPTSSCGGSAARGSGADRRTASSRSSCRCPASTTSTTRWPRSPPRGGWASPASRSGPACSRFAPPSDGSRRSRSEGGRWRSC